MPFTSAYVQRLWLLLSYNWFPHVTKERDLVGEKKKPNKPPTKTKTNLPSQNTASSQLSD